MPCSRKLLTPLRLTWTRAGLALASSAWLLTSALTSAAIPVVQTCQEADYEDRTAPAADRQLAWDFDIGSQDERCMKIRVGQSVSWIGNFSDHPFTPQGGDTPTPIPVNPTGPVTFNTPGVFGWTCVIHLPMRGAVWVVPADPPRTPGIGSLGVGALGAMLLLIALSALRNGRLFRDISLRSRLH